MQRSRLVGCSNLRVQYSVTAPSASVSRHRTIGISRESGAGRGERRTRIVSVYPPGKGEISTPGTEGAPTSSNGGPKPTMEKSGKRPFMGRVLPETRLTMTFSTPDRSGTCPSSTPPLPGMRYWISASSSPRSASTVHASSPPRLYEPRKLPGFLPKSHTFDLEIPAPSAQAVRSTARIGRTIRKRTRTATSLVLVRRALSIAYTFSRERIIRAVRLPTD